MIHAKDIMVGDWVILYGSLTRWGYTDYAKWHNEMERTDIHAVEPVRLTPEILEKNGFQAGGYEILVFETDEYHFALQKGVDGINNWWWDMFCSPIIPINYVHELQHALRLCGIEKEIEL